MKDLEGEKGGCAEMSKIANKQMICEVLMDAAKTDRGYCCSVQ